jgi:acyl-coenzyme A thioesterase PaaI-like protein
MSGTLSLYERFTRFPLGTILFNRALGFRVPYVSTIHPDVTDLRSGYCQVEIKDRRSIRNHLGSVNAGALCLLGELTGGLAVEATLPSNLRFITKEMTVQFLKKAKGNLVGKCSVDPSVLVPGDVKVPVEIKDGTGDTVLNAMIVFYIGERKSANRIA